MFSIVIISFLQLLPISWSKDNCATSSKLPQKMSPQTIQHFAKTFKIGSPGDMLCCLARDYDVEFIVSHSSIAAQNGDFQNPRVLMTIKDKFGFAGVVSLNSGASHLNQRSSLEMLVENSARKEVEFYDLNFENGRSHLSTKNPESCMGCHASGGVGGPRLLFEEFPWPRFIHHKDFTEIQQTHESSECPNTSPMQNVLTKKTLEEMKKKPAYRCVDESKLANLGHFDNGVLRKLNERRIVNQLRRRPSYHQIKFALVGIDLCDDFQLSEWLPNRIFVSMNSTTTIDKKVLDAKSNTQLEELLRTKLAKDFTVSKTVDRRYNSDAKLVKNGKPIQFNPQLGEGACRSQETREENIRETMSELEAGGDPLYKKYYMDTKLRQVEDQTSVRILALQRQLIEGEGGDISNWGMNPVGGYERSFVLTDEILSRESNKSVLRQALNYDGRKLPGKSLVNDKNLEQVCNKLKELSLNAFGSEEKNIPHAGSVVQ